MHVHLQAKLDLLLAVTKRSMVLYFVSSLCLLLALFMLSYMVRKKSPPKILDESFGSSKKASSLLW